VSRNTGKQKFSPTAELKDQVRRRLRTFFYHILIVNSINLVDCAHAIFYGTAGRQRISPDTAQGRNGLKEPQTYPRDWSLHEGDRRHVRIIQIEMHGFLGHRARSTSTHPLIIIAASHYPQQIRRSFSSRLCTQASQLRYGKHVYRHSPPNCKRMRQEL
jgi:hypothetical protein